MPSRGSISRASDVLGMFYQKLAGAASSTVNVLRDRVVALLWRIVLRRGLHTAACVLSELCTPMSDGPLARRLRMSDGSSAVEGKPVGAAINGTAARVTDCPLEGGGFELPVPRAIRLRFRDFALARLR